MSDWDRLGRQYEQPPLGQTRTLIVKRMREEGDRLQAKLEAIEDVLSRKHEATIWDYQTTLDVLRELLHSSNQKVKT